MHLLITFLISMLPLVELRGSIPYGFAAGLPLWQVVTVSVVGNLLPVPFIILFIRKIFDWLKDKGKFGRFVHRMERKASRGAQKVLGYRWMWLGLFLFVAIPLPGTGAWSGALAAAILDLRLRKAVPAITLGVVVMAITFTMITYGTRALIS